MSFTLLASIYPPTGHDDLDRFLDEYLWPRKDASRCLQRGDHLTFTHLDLSQYFVPACSGQLHSATLGDCEGLPDRDLLSLKGNDDVGKNGVTLRLSGSRLAGGSRRWAQVWLARPTDESQPMPKHFALRSGQSPSAVVIKIYQDGRYYAPNLNDLLLNGHESNAAKGLSEAVWMPSPVAAARECIAYGRMQDIQGVRLPKSFGFCRTLLTEGEEEAAHIMSWVPGRPIDEVLSEVEDDPERLFNLIDSFAHTLYRIHQCGVIHRDLKSEHVRVNPRNVDPKQFHVRIVDFGISHVLRSDFNIHSFYINRHLSRSNPFEPDLEQFRTLICGANPEAKRVFDFWLDTQCANMKWHALVVKWGRFSVSD